MEIHNLFAFVSETGTAIAVQAMNNRYPNVHFEGKEDGAGRYMVTVQSKHEREVHQRTVELFRHELVQGYEVACVAVRLLTGQGGDQ